MAKTARHFALSFLALLLLGCLLAPSAGATTLYYHPLIGHFGAGGAGSEEKFYFSGPPVVAVDQGSHDVYVIAAQKKAGVPNFYRFTASGEPAPFTAGTGSGTNKKILLANGIAVAPPGAPGGTAGDLYASVEGKVEVYSSTGAHLGTIDGSGNPNPGSETAGTVAVDPAGNLYIGYGGEHLDKYVPTANPPLNSDFDSELRFEGQTFGDVAFSPSALYIAVPYAFGAHWFRYPPTAFPGGNGSATLSPEGPGLYMYNTLATDFSNGDLYTSTVHYHSDPHYPPPGRWLTESGIDQYDAAGNLVSFTVAPNIVEGDFDVDATSGQLYVPIDNSPEEADVRIYGDGEAVEPPIASIDSVTNFDYRSAHFTGTVNPGGSGKLQETAYNFECKPECPGLEGQRTIPGDGADHVVSDDAVELQPETKYEVTLIAWNTTLSTALTAAEVRSTTSFETPAKPTATAPEVTIDPVTEFGAESAHFSGEVTAGGTDPAFQSSCVFDYVDDASFQHQVNERQQLTIKAEGGTFYLRFYAPNPEFVNGTTAPIAFDAPASGLGSVQEALENLPGMPFGSFNVTGGPGDIAGSNPYVIEFTGPLAGTYISAGLDLYGGGLTPPPPGVGGGAIPTLTIGVAGGFKSANARHVECNPGEIGGTAATPVSADATQLEPNTTYHVQLRASNSGGESTALAPTFTTPGAPPAVVTRRATNIERESAILHGRVNPKNQPTKYWFEWGRGECSSNPCQSIPASQDADAGSGGQDVAVSQQLTGLERETTYHYRLVAKNASGETASQDVSFSTEASTQACANARSGFSAALPDCRAYELVSPVNKRGSDVMGRPLRTRSSSDGEAVSYGANTSFGDTAGSSTAGVDYMSVRGPDGWSTHPLSPFQTPVELPSGFSSSQFTGEFSSDLEEGIFRGLTPVPGTGGENVARVPNLYLASGMRSGTPHFQLLSDAPAPVPAVPQETSPHINFAGASADFKHIVFESHDNLTPDASGEGDKAYEWTGGEERLVGILPDSACEAPPCVAPESAIGAGALLDLTYGAGAYTNLAHAISEDGSRIFFTAGGLKDWGSLGGASAGFAGSLYVRINGQSTVQIDASERSTPDPNGPGRSHFLMATPDGKTAFFLSQEELVNADTDGTGISLYRYEADAPAGEHLSLVDTAGVLVQHIIAMTPDMTYMYFLGTERGHVYVKHGSDVHRIASGLSHGYADNLGQIGAQPQGESHWDEARMSADGRRLLFGSNADLGLYAPYNPDVTQLYLYDYASDELVCASCSENGTAPTSHATFNGTYFQMIDVGGPGYSAGIYNNTPFTSNGRYVFFSTRDSLVAGDTNGHMDAYSYDVETGKLHLISTGQCNCDSLFLTASPSGRDVFFSTHQQLVRADVDNLADIYDARMGGGIAAQNALPPAECQGDACQAAPSPPNDATPASASFNGAGNLAPPHRRAHKHHRKRHSKHAHRRSHGRRANSRRRAGK